jgi:hypothetical protein
MTLLRLLRFLFLDFLRLRRAHAAMKSRVRRILQYDRTAPQDAQLLALANELLLDAQRQQFGRDIGMRAIAIDRDPAGRKTVVYRLPAGGKIRQP